MFPAPSYDWALHIVGSSLQSLRYWTIALHVLSPLCCGFAINIRKNSFHNIVVFNESYSNAELLPVGNVSNFICINCKEFFFISDTIFNLKYFSDALQKFVLGSFWDKMHICVLLIDVVLGHHHQHRFAYLVMLKNCLCS